MGEGPITSLLHDDPDPGEPILCFGAAWSQSQLTVPKLPAPPIDPDGGVLFNAYCSHASLENVERVLIFSYESEGRRRCIGILLEYLDGNRESLGQCRFGFSTTTRVDHPSMFHYTSFPLGPNCQGVDVRFSPKSSECQLFGGPGWHSSEMNGSVTW